MLASIFNTYTLRVYAMWIFLAPLIILLGTADLLTDQRTRSWPFAD